MGLKHLEWEWNWANILTLKLVPKISMRLSRMNPTSLESAASTFVLRSTSALSGVTEIIGPLRLLNGPLRELVTDVTVVIIIIFVIQWKVKRFNQDSTYDLSQLHKKHA